MADNAIRIPVVVELDAATGQFQKLRTTADREVGATARTVETHLRTVETAATRTAASTVNVGESMKESLHGVAPAVATMTGAFSAAGVKIPAGLGAITTGISTLLTTGIGPLGLALAGATGIISLLSSLADKQSAATSAADSHTEALERQADSMERIARLEGRLGEVRTGIPESVRDLQRREGSLAFDELMARGRRDRIAGQIGALEARGSMVEPGMRDRLAESKDRVSEISKELQLVRDELRLIREIDRVRQEMEMRAEDLPQIRDMSPISEPVSPLSPAETWRARREREESIRRQEMSIGPADLPTIEYIGSPYEAAFSAADAAELRRQRVARELDFDARQRVASAESMMEALIAQQDREREVRDRGLMGEDPTVREGLPTLRSTSARIDPYTQTLNRSLSQSVEGAMIGGISSALSDPGNWQGALESFASAIQSAVSTRIASGLVDALMGNTQTNTYGAQGIIGSLITAWIGGSKPPSTTGTEGVGTGDPMAPDVSGDGPGKMASQPIVVVNTYDESFADATVARASAAGFRVGLAKASGGGVSRGAIPSRGGR